MNKTFPAAALLPFCLLSSSFALTAEKHSWSASLLYESDTQTLLTMSTTELQEKLTSFRKKCVGEQPEVAIILEIYQGPRVQNIENTPSSLVQSIKQQFYVAGYSQDRIYLDWAAQDKSIEKVTSSKKTLGKTTQIEIEVVCTFAAKKQPP